MIMDTHCFPSVHITINIQHRHDNEIHLVQHLCHAWVFSIFWDNLKMNKDTLLHNTQICLSRTAAKYIFGWSYFLFFVHSSIKDSMTFRPNLVVWTDTETLKNHSWECYPDAPWFSSLVPKNLPCFTFLFIPAWENWNVTNESTVVLLMIILRYHQTFLMLSALFSHYFCLIWTKFSNF